MTATAKQLGFDDKGQWLLRARAAIQDMTRAQDESVRCAGAAWGAALVCLLLSVDDEANAAAHEDKAAGFLCLGVDQLMAAGQDALELALRTASDEHQASLRKLYDVALSFRGALRDHAHDDALDDALDAWV